MWVFNHIRGQYPWTLALSKGQQYVGKKARVEFLVRTEMRNLEIYSKRGRVLSEEGRVSTISEVTILSLKCIGETSRGSERHYRKKKPPRKQTEYLWPRNQRT